jgi:hypothetical protein
MIKPEVVVITSTCDITYKTVLVILNNSDFVKAKWLGSLTLKLNFLSQFNAMNCLNDHVLIKHDRVCVCVCVGVCVCVCVGVGGWGRGSE